VFGVEGSGLSVSVQGSASSPPLLSRIWAGSAWFWDAGSVFACLGDDGSVFRVWGLGFGV